MLENVASGPILSSAERSLIERSLDLLTRCPIKEVIALIVKQHIETCRKCEQLASQLLQQKALRDRLENVMQSARGLEAFYEDFGQLGPLFPNE